MGKDSAISWCDHTFNPWWGCTKVSPACTNCYAASFDHRLGGEHWGDKAPRKFFGDNHWNEPRKWNKAAMLVGKQARVFCASMADVFEDRDDLVPHRNRLWQLILETPFLDWLLLTKRPENIVRMSPRWSGEIFKNVWLGTTVENQEYADARIPHLMAAPAVVHFLSCEPLLGPIDLFRLPPMVDRIGSSLDWVIAGCESGPGARQSDVAWFTSLRNQCTKLDIAFFAKQAREIADVCDECGESISYYAHSPTLCDASCGCTVEGPETCDPPPISFGDGSKRKVGGVIELPYLDGMQHAAFPEIR